MDKKSQRHKRQDGVLSSLNVAIDAVNIAKDVMNFTPAKAAFGSVSVVLTMIRDAMINEVDYVELGLACADVCRALDRGMNGRRVNELSQSVIDAIEQLTTAVAGIQRNIVKRSKRNVICRHFHAKNDKEMIATWRLDLNRILHVFNTELAMNTIVVVSDIHHDVTSTHAIVSDVHQGVVDTHTIISGLRHEVSDIHRTIVKGQEGPDTMNQSAQASVLLGEAPPPPPRSCFGRDELIEKVVGLAQTLTPIALIGGGGIGKTSIALTLLHHNHIKQKFGDNRRFLRCDQFPATCAQFLNQLSAVIGAGVENPGSLALLRPFLSSREMIIILDNAESILDPQGMNAQEIYNTVEELCQFETICLCITSRISTVPKYCKRPMIPTLSMESACSIFYSICDNGEQSNIINDLLRELDFHALSITLLATTASHNMWDHDRLVQEWERQRTQVLQIDYNESLAATINLSLASPTFCELGHEANDLLGVIAFFPQGINESNLDWLFPTISNRRAIFDKFCVLSLTHRHNGFVTMLAPLRDYLCPKYPLSSPLLCRTKQHYFSRLSVSVNPGKSGFKEAQWITLEDVNVEHLLDIFTTIDADSVDVWDACEKFLWHLYWHKKRLVTLGPKIEALPDNHPSKPGCLKMLSLLFGSVGNWEERKQLLLHTLKLQREGGDSLKVAHTLVYLSGANRMLHLYKEGIQQVKEASEIFRQFDDRDGCARSLQKLARLLCDDQQLDAAEDTALQAIGLLMDEGMQSGLCRCHRLLGDIYSSKGETEKAIHHFMAALGIASSLNWHSQLCFTHQSLANLFLHDNRFDDAHTHTRHAKSYAVNDQYLLGDVTKLQAEIWYTEHRFKEAKSEALCAIDIYGKIGAVKEAEDCGAILQDIEEKMKLLANSGEQDSNACATK